MAEPLPHLRAQEVGKVGLAGPDCRHKGGPIGLFAEVSFFQPFGAGGVVGINTHAGIDDGHQPDALRFQVLLGLVAPAALCQTECPPGRDVAAADEGAELLADRILVPAGEEIQIIVGSLGVERE